MNYERERVRRSERRHVVPGKTARGSPAILGKVTTASPAVGKFLNWHPVTMIGDEVEGHTPTLEVHTGITHQAELVQGTAAQNDVILFRWTEWRWVTDGKGAAPSGFNWTFNVRGCASTGVAGALVELRQSGVLIASGTTADGTGGTTLGRVVLNVPAGSYNITITGPSGAGFAVNTATATLAGAATRNVTLAADSDHVCWGCCNFPLPKEFHSANADGPITLAWDPTSGSTPRYTLITSTEVSSACENTGAGCFGCSSPATIELRYTLTFNASCIVQFGIGCAITCCSFVARFWIGGFVGNPIPIVVGTFDCDTFVGTFSVPEDFTAFPAGDCETVLPVPGGGGVFVFTP